MNNTPNMRFSYGTVQRLTRQNNGYLANETLKSCNFFDTKQQRQSMITERLGAFCDGLP